MSSGVGATCPLLGHRVLKTERAQQVLTDFIPVGAGRGARECLQQVGCVEGVLCSANIDCELITHMSAIVKAGIRAKPRVCWRQCKNSSFQCYRVGETRGGPPLRVGFPSLGLYLQPLPLSKPQVRWAPVASGRPPPSLPCTSLPCSEPVLLREGRHRDRGALKQLQLITKHRIR